MGSDRSVAGDKERGSVERLVAGGAGLIRHSLGIRFVRGALPGEEVLYRIRGKRKGVFVGELLEVLTPSPDRVEPPCPYYDRCGGCELQELEYGAQLEAKEEILREQLRRIGGFTDPPVEPIRSGPGYGYRTRLRLHRSAGGEYGFRERWSSIVVPVERCLVATDALNHEIASLTDAPPDLGELRLAVADEGVLRSDRAENGHATLLGYRIRFSGSGFFQGNLPLFERLLRELVDAVDPPPNYLLYDLYGGTGAIASVVARALQDRTGKAPSRVVTVEPDQNSSAYADANLEPFSHTLERITAERFAHRSAPVDSRSIVIVDPPRAGLAPPVRQWLRKGEPARLLYVSCDPSTLARDLKELSPRYTIASIRPFDFFPQTSHVESLTLLLPAGVEGA